MQPGAVRNAERRCSGSPSVPRLLDFADDASLDDQTHSWVFQALRDITGQTMPPDAAAWRRWYARSRCR